MKEIPTTPSEVWQTYKQQILLIDQATATYPNGPWSAEFTTPHELWQVLCSMPITEFGLPEINATISLGLSLQRVFVSESGTALADIRDVYVTGGITPESVISRIKVLKARKDELR